MLINILEILGGVTPEIIDVLADIQGLECDIYYPTSMNSVYGTYSNKFEYPDLPNEVKNKYLITGLFKYGFQGQGNIGFDTFFEEQPHIVTHKGKIIPPSSKIIVYFHNAKMTFRTEIDKAMPGVDGPLVVIQELKPMT